MEAQPSSGSIELNAAPEPPPTGPTVFISVAHDADPWYREVIEAFDQARSTRGLANWNLFAKNIPWNSESLIAEATPFDAAVVLFSPSYMTSAPTNIEYTELGRREAEEDLPIFRVLAVDIPLDDAYRLDLDKYQLFNARPLANMDREEREKVLADLAERIFQSGAEPSRERTRRKGQDRPAQQQQDELDPSGLMDISEITRALDRYKLSGPARQMVLRAAGHARALTPPVDVSTELLLYAIADFATSSGDIEWTSAWVLETLGSKFVDDFSAILRARSGDAGGVDDDIWLSEGAQLALDTASEFSAKTSSDGLIHPRHLFAAILTDTRGFSTARQTLTQGGFSVDTLKKSFLDAVRGRDDNDREWSLILLGRELRVYRMAGFHADDTGGKDLLGIEQEVLAFATLIAARSVTPPLSIGLFGEWGSGKSFFMRHLRTAVAGLARESARSGQMQRDLPFYKRIVQIEFNAWHYVEGNLWASLVEHIFRNLKVPGDPPSVSEALQKRLIDDLKFTEQAKAEANEQLRQAEDEQRVADERVVAARLEHERQREELARVAAKQVAQELTIDEVRAAVEPVLERLGIPKVATSAREMLDSLAQARELVNRGSRIFLPLVQAPKGERRWKWILLLMALFLGPLVGWLVGMAVAAIGDAAMAQLTALASGAATLLTFGATWVRAQVKWGNDRLTEVEKARREVDRRLAEKEAEQTRQLRELEQALQLAKADYDAARRRQADAEQRVKEAKAKLEDASVARLLASFIEDRASSADYRKHLGVLALVRNDFETLSGLIEEENWRLSPAGHDDDRYPRATRFATLDEEEAKAESRINRIVLYIDDLDRCPPAKVVEVLQAVHLLLAFPLFVVVVGVDARWVKRSLEVRYRELLHGSDGDASISSAELLIGKATTDDYLEKIFQVPFWLRRMGDKDTADMVRGLLAGNLAAEPAPPPTTLTSNVSAGQETSAEAPTEADFVDTESSSDAAATESPASTDRPAARVQVGVIAQQDRPAQPIEQPQINPESLVFHAEELEFMAVLAPLLDRSPRALKRFVNIYRLVKAGLTPSEQRAFIGAEEDYKSVLFLLAVDAGPPEIADDLFAALRNITPVLGGGTGEGAATLFSLVTSRIASVGNVVSASSAPSRTGPAIEVADKERRWKRIQAWLRPDPEKDPAFNPTPAQLARWEPRVTRFSFRAQA